MIRNYLLTAFRSFAKHRTFTILNIVGLSIGLVASLLILQYVKYERSYDTFHSRAEDIYRIQYNVWQNGKLRFECAAAVPAAGPALKNNFPEVEHFTRLFPVSGVVSYEDPQLGLVSHLEEKMQIVDSSVFDIFDFKLLQGTKEDVLSGPNKAVISQRAAKKFFGDQDPIGKNIAWNGTWRFEVRGVFEDIPANSHIKFDFMFSYQTLVAQSQGEAETSWDWYDFNTYVLLKPGTDVAALQSKWDAYLQELNGEEWTKRNQKREFILQPILDIHLYANLLQESQPAERGDGDSVYALSFIAFFILVIAWVNYINLATAKSFDRANEVGVRKAMGAQRGQLMRQFIAESFLVNAFAAVIALVAVRALWPLFSGLSGRDIPVTYMLEGEFWLLFGALFVLGTVLSGSYPALVLSSFKPVAVLKGKVMRTTQGSLLRKGLVVFQFAASVVLISGSIIVYQQLRFMSNQDLGVDINQTLVLRGPGITDSTITRRIDGFRNEVLRINGITSMTASSNVPGDEIFWARGIRKLTDGIEKVISAYTVGIDHDYISSFGLEVIAGRGYDRQHPDERRNLVINRAMSDALDFKSPDEAVGSRVIAGDTMEIIGVIENYHQMSLKESVIPLIYRYSPDFTQFFAFKLNTGNASQVLASLEGPWQTFFAGNPIDYFYLDEFFNKQYESDKQFGQIFGLFTVLAIFIACLGLYGLASFLTMQRTKEIGIRKVLGSSASGIVLLLSKGFIQLVVVANLVAWPVAWLIMENWLQGFPYRIGINPLLFVFAGCGVVAIAFLSVGFQTLKAALINPAQTLKYE